MRLQSLAPLIYFLGFCLSANSFAQSRILVIGDSHTARQFGSFLFQNLSERTSNLKVVGSCGVSPWGYLTGFTTHCGYTSIESSPNGPLTQMSNIHATPSLESLLHNFNPNVTVVALGANQVRDLKNPRDRDARQSIAQQFRRIMQMISTMKSRCLWIAPPSCKAYSTRELKEYYELLEKENQTLNSPCVIFDSRPTVRKYLDYDLVATQARKQGDGIHYDSLGQAGRAALHSWANDASDSILLLTQ